MTSVSEEIILSKYSPSSVEHSYIVEKENTEKKKEVGRGS
jgi:hypothetical protein